VDVRSGRDRVAALADAAHHGALLHCLAFRGQDLAELEQRDGVAVRRLERDRLPAARHRPGERDRSCSRSAHGGSQLAADVDAPVLATRVRVVAQHERA
jgi:hypothetical protein